jgi:hypothetical protein
LIGVGADVHMGLFDDSKYVNEMKEEFAGEKRADKPESANPQKPVSAAEQKRQLVEIDNDLLDTKSEIDVKKLVDIWASIAERDGWSKTYWDEALRKFKERRDTLREAA